MNAINRGLRESCRANRCISRSIAHLDVCGIAAFHAAKFAIVKVDLEHRDGLLTRALIHVHSEWELRWRKALLCTRRPSIQSEMKDEDLF